MSARILCKCAGLSQLQYTHAPVSPFFGCLKLILHLALLSAPMLRGQNSATLFDSQVAPILARHCLECHDTSTRKGMLDLSQRATAESGGKHGPAIVPGHPDQSLLWTSIESGEMPEDRPPLSADEKSALKRWIESGAVWTTDTIDPLALNRDRPAAVNWVRRLTIPEYIATVHAATGVDISREAREWLPPDSRADGFSNTAYNLKVDLAHIEAAARLAALITTRLDLPAFTARFTRDRKTDPAALRSFIEKAGRWLLRAPLDDAEKAAFLKLATAVAKSGASFDETAATVIEAMLQSPRFLYRIEDHRTNGKARPAAPHEIASRLSYLIWGAPPDEELNRTADAGDLAKPATLHAQIARMLEDPRAIEQSRHFLSEWLHLDRLDHLQPDRAHYPNWRPELAADMRAETLAFIDEIIWTQRAPLVRLLDAPVTFLTPRLARHYGLDPRLGKPATAAAAHGEKPDRITSGILAWYRFDEGKGDRVRDHSGSGLDLVIEKPAAVTWTPDGLELRQPALLATAQSSATLVAALQETNALSLEAWVTPADTKQKGPARILSLSHTPGKRNFTLGQEGDKWEVRLRTTKTNDNGQPGLQSKSGLAASKPTHIIYSRDRVGRAWLFIDGRKVTDFRAAGDFANWDESFRLLIGNESSNDRPWLGTLHQIAIYDRELSGDEVAQNHAAGLRGDGLLEDAAPARYDLTHIPHRRGLLTHGSVLTIGGDEASMVTRGLFILHDLLHSTVGSAPPGVDTTPVPSKPGFSQRAVSEARLADTSCTACHSKFEPLAFAFEKFDGLGSWQEKDAHGNPLREDGQFTLPGQKDPIPYQTTAEFVTELASSDRAARNFTRKLAQFALGRPLLPSDTPHLDAIHAASVKNGHTYQSLLTALATSPLLLQTHPEGASIAKRK